LIRRVWWWK